MLSAYYNEHRAIVIGGGVALLIILGGIYSNYQHVFLTHDEPLKTQELAVPASTTEESLLDRDSDNDGLPDWEERLYGSDPFIADTDGDGTPDGVEVRAHRNPSVANTAPDGETPNDTLQIIQDPNFATSSTDILGIKKEFFAKLLAEKSQEIRTETYHDLLQNNFDPKRYAPTTEYVDLNISSDNSNEALHAYGNALGVIIKKYANYKTRTEEAILADATKTKDSQALKELQIPAIGYRDFANELRTLKVPSSMAQYHLLIVNAYDGMSKALLDLQMLYSNPITGAGAYEAYTLSRVDVTTGFANIVVAFKKADIVFAPNEPGAPLSGPITTTSTEQ